MKIFLIHLKWFLVIAIPVALLNGILDFPILMIILTGSLAGIISRIISENEVEKKGLRD